MKTTLKLSTLLVAIASAFTFSSCLNNDDDSTYPTYSSYVTITGDQFIGYTFYSDEKEKRRELAEREKLARKEEERNIQQ